MGEVIDRRAADIHPHVRWIERRENALLAGQRIVELQLHRQSTCARLRASRGAQYSRHVLGLLAGACLKSRGREKDGRSQRLALANNLPANAEDVPTAHAMHNGRGGTSRQGPLLASCRRIVWIVPLKEGLTLVPALLIGDRRTIAAPSVD